MQVWNVRQAARWKYRMQKWCKKLPSEHHRTTMSGYIFATKACIDNRKKHIKQQYLLQMSLQYGELPPTNGWDRLAGLGYPIIFQWVSRHGSVTARQSSSGRQPNLAAFNRGCHLCLAGRPSGWALAHILVMAALCNRCVFLPCDFYLLSFFLFFPHLISAVGDWMSTILPHMVWQKSPKMRHLGTIVQLVGRCLRN